MACTDPVKIYAKDRDVPKEWTPKTSEMLDREIERIYLALKALGISVNCLLSGGTGAAGATGATGPMGPAGLMGDDGDDGAVGPIGPMGPAGAAGAAGAVGLMGMPGLDGIDGDDFPMPPGSTFHDGILYYEPLSDGDATQPELIFAAGEVIMIPVFG